MKGFRQSSSFVVYDKTFPYVLELLLTTFNQLIASEKIKAFEPAITEIKKFYKIAVLQNFGKFKGKIQFRSFILIKFKTSSL